MVFVSYLKCILISRVRYLQLVVSLRYKELASSISELRFRPLNLFLKE